MNRIQSKKQSRKLGRYPIPSLIRIQVNKNQNQTKINKYWSTAFTIYITIISVSSCIQANRYPDLLCYSLFPQPSARQLFHAQRLLSQSMSQSMSLSPRSARSAGSAGNPLHGDKSRGDGIGIPMFTTNKLFLRRSNGEVPITGTQTNNNIVMFNTKYNIFIPRHWIFSMIAMYIYKKSTNSFHHTVLLKCIY